MTSPAMLRAIQPERDADAVFAAAVRYDVARFARLADDPAPDVQPLELQ